MCRSFLCGLSLAAAFLLAPRPAPAGETPANWTNDLTPLAASDWNRERAAHLLERAGFGGTPEEIDKLAAMTPAQAVNALVDYESIDASGLPAFEPSGIYPHGAKFMPLEKVVVKALTTGKAYGVKATREGDLPLQPGVNEFYTLLVSEHAEMRRASQWWANRMLATPRPLEEKLTLFWHDHFATSQEKLVNYELMLRQIETLRAHASGNFHKLLVAIAQDPAMLIWLDNRENVKGKPNENFAREIMELFTLGEGHGYSETDIREMARAFTGWTLSKIEMVADKVEFIDNPRLHDDGEKTFLHQTGNFNGHDAIRIILEQPAAPRFLAGKLYRFFAREQLDAAVEEQLAATLRQHTYEIKPLLKQLFLSRDFYSRASVGTQIKSPVQFVVSSCRKLGLAGVPGIPDYIETTMSQGQLLFFPPNVAGWPGDRSWINPATLLSRGNYVHDVLFPDPDKCGAPDKVVAEGYRKIPLLFTQYHIEPRVWNRQSRKMEPATLGDYEKFLASLDSGMQAMTDESGETKKPGYAPVTAMAPGMQMSKMSQVSQTEQFNLAVGVYTGFVQAYDRVRPIERTTASVDFARMAQQGRARTVDEAVDYFSRRFLRVELQAERRAAIVDFLKGELGASDIGYGQPGVEAALRRAVHLILSAPEFQLS